MDKDDPSDDDERILNECVRRIYVDVRESKDDLDEERMEFKGVKGPKMVDEEMGVENDDSMGRGQGDEMIVLGGAKRKRTEDRLGSD